MNIAKKIRIAGALSLVGVLGGVASLSARENVVGEGHKSQLKTTVTGCQPAVSAIDLDINNVRARLMTGGDMWWNIGLEVAAYEIPKNSGRSSQFAASCWIGGYDKQGQLKVAAQTYRQDGNDYWPGALDPATAKVASEDCANWDRFWKVEKSTILKFIELSKSGSVGSDAQYDVIKEWPATGNVLNTKGANGTPVKMYGSYSYAPFVDLNGNGLYEPASGEYPDISGDQFIWWVTNDAGNVKQQTQTAAMGIEVQTSAFAYSTQDFLNNSTFYKYRVINRGALTIDSTYIAVWDDCDLGYYMDDYIGCDTSRGLGIMYNGSSNDGQDGGYPVNSYGANPPQIGVDFFQGPLRPVKINGKDTFQRLSMTNFTYYNNDNSTIGNPTNGLQIYRYMTGSIRNGDRFRYDFQGPGIASTGYGSGPIANAVFTGDPGDKTTWSECTCNNQRGDRRFIFSSGPFQLLPGAANDIIFGCVWASGVGGCPNTDFKTIKSIDDNAQALFEAGFKTVEGPEAPKLLFRELDRRLVFSIVNEYGSNNYAENYGRNDGAYNDSLKYHQIVAKAKSEKSSDSLYHFEGYRVFQLANSSVTPAEIFDATTGEVNPDKAYEVFQCDITNKVTKIVNYTKNTSVSDSTWVPSIKVVGKDSGIQHSFQITQDHFSKVADKQLINYHNYYFVAIAYAYNNFAPFDPSGNNYQKTQDVAYIGSAHGAGQTAIPVTVVMPNPSNGAMGTTLNADYGSGIIVTRVEGTGNGGHVVELSDATTTEILEKGEAPVAVYNQGAGPIDIKVVDPVLVPAMDWIFQIKGNLTGTQLATSATWELTAVKSNGDKETIYSERDLSTLNEQILEKYGLSVNVEQAQAPGVQQDKGNGYITSYVTFADRSKPWLAGVPDQEDSSFANWIRSGQKKNYSSNYSLTNPCDFNDNALDTFQVYEGMFDNFTPTRATWAPYPLIAPYNGRHYGTGTLCGFQFAYSNANQNAAGMALLPDVNLVFTKDRSKWTRCVVVEMQDDSMLSENHGIKFFKRKHRSWNGDIDANGRAVYSKVEGDDGFSWFPGYAIDQNTGQRLNIVFGEDSYLANDNGADMIWNPSANIFSPYDASVIFGGKHVIYVLGSKYDEDHVFDSIARVALPTNSILGRAYSAARWVGVPTSSASAHMLSLRDSLIPTETTLRFRVNRPYAPFLGDTAIHSLYNTDSARETWPYYKFSTKDLAARSINDNPDRSGLVDKINIVPNPYYGYSGYETSRFDTKVRIINLPAKVSVRIYSLDGTLVRTLSKSDVNTSYLDWDVRNAAGLPIAGGMYLIHIQAEGIGEKVLKWFGAMRPIDATSY